MATTWLGCYDDNWQTEITPEAFSHPAKYARGLIRRIYGHMLAQGWISAGDRIVDPFGGVALGGIDAMVNGLHWTGCELEPRFVALGNQNIQLWRQRYGSVSTGSARLLQGDSRRLCEVVSEADGIVSSPPYEECELNYGKNGILEDGKTPYQRPYMRGQDGYSAADGIVSSPPFSEVNNQPAGRLSSTPIRSKTEGMGRKQDDNYGTTPNNIGNQSGETFWQAAREIVQQCHAILKPGAYTAWVVKGYVKGGKLVDFPARWRQLCEACGFEHVEEVHAMLVKEQVQGVDLFSGEAVVKRTKKVSFFRRLAEKNGSPPIDYETVLFMRKVGTGGSVDGVVSSPPFEDSLGTKDEEFWAKHNDETRNWNGATRNIADYGTTPGQLGAMPAGKWEEVC